MELFDSSSEDEAEEAMSTFSSSRKNKKTCFNSTFTFYGSIYARIKTFCKDKLERTAGELPSELRDDLILAHRILFVDNGCQTLTSPQVLSSLEKCEAICNSCIRIGWNMLEENGTWPQPCYREMYIFSQLMLSCCKIAHGKLKDAVQCADFAFIVGAPKEETNLIFRLVDPEVRKLRLELGQGQNESLLVKLNGISDRGNYIDIQKGVRNIAPLVHLIQVDEVEAPSLEAFEKIFMSAKPCVLKNLISDWKAIEKWPHLHFFRNSYGHRQVPIEVYEGENRELKEQTMSLKSFIDEFIIPSCLVDQGKEIGKGKVAYLAQHSLFDQLPELQSHFSPPKYIDANTDAEIVKCSIWFGTSDTITPLHYDSYNNFFMQIAGFKCVVLFPNDETEKLYPIVDSKHSTAAQGNISAVDVGNPDTLSYPLYEKATGYKVLLKPGDTLFIPKGAWHYVQSLTPSLSINFFWNIKK